MDETLPTCANVGIVSLGLTMAQGFMAFYRPWKSYDEEIQTLTESLQGLQDITSYLGVSFSNKGSLNNIPEDLRQLVMATLLSCQDACRRLEDMLDECKATDCSPFLRKHDWLRSRGAVYPFKKDTLVTLRSIVSDLRGNLFLALQLLPSIDSRVAAIDNRTAMILRAVGGGIPSIGQLQSVLREQLTIVSRGQPSMFDPSTHRDFCDRQTLINRISPRSWLLGSSAIDIISKFCACTRRPLSYSALSILTLHENHCPLYQAEQKTIGFAAKRDFCNELLGLSLSFMMTLTRGAGGVSISPTLQSHRIVRHESLAFDLISKTMFRAYQDDETTCKTIGQMKIGLLELFREKKVAPTDRLDDGRTILHYIVEGLGFRYNRSMDMETLQSLHGLILVLIEAGVPANERTAKGMTVADGFLWGVSFVINKLGSHDLALGLNILKDLLSAGSYLRPLGSIMLSGHETGPRSEWEKRQLCFAELVHNMTRTEREFAVSNIVEDFELSPIEAAILKRSEEDLRHCLSESLPRFSEADMARPHFEFLLPMCLDWVPGMLLFLESALPRSAGAVGNSFIGACRAREFASALLLLGYMDEISYQHLYDAFECGDIEVMKTTSSQLATRRSQLQELALQQLPPNVIQSLELPKHGLLDIKSFNVCKALEQHKIIVDQRLIVQDSGSVYTHVGKGGVAAANILYESGFTDMNQYDMDGCNTISSVYPVKELGQVLGLVHWMICKGADIHLPSRGSPSITVIARTLADCLPCPAFFTPEDWFTRVNHIIKSLHIDSARLLLTILLDDDGNSGLCGCTKLKHTSLIVALECLTQRDSGFTGAHVAYIQDVLNQRCSEKTSREVVSVTLRYFTFKALGLTHSCDRQNCSYDDIWRIRTEERPLLDELEALLVDFNERYDALGVGLPEFFLGYWQTCMSGVPAADTPGEEYIQAQEL